MSLGELGLAKVEPSVVAEVNNTGVVEPSVVAEVNNTGVVEPSVVAEVNNTRNIRIFR